MNAASSTSNGALSYKDYGLFICEAHVMKYCSKYTLPKSVLSDFKEDLADLMDVSRGVGAQVNVLNRIQWMYSKWM